MVGISGVGALGSVGKSTGSRKKGKVSTQGSSKKDRIQISDAESLRTQAKAMIADMPDVRLERIEGIRDALESGKFRYDSKKIAAQIVRNALAERAW